MRCRADRILAGILLTCAIASAAAEERGREPVYLDADEAEMDGATGIGTYTGNVILTQGEREITGDVMIVHTREGRELDWVEVEGTPATWRETPAGNGEVIWGEAPRMEYHARGPERIRLLQGAKVEQGRNTFTGETIEYNLETDVVKALGKDDEERIRVTLFPHEDDSE